MSEATKTDVKPALSKRDTTRPAEVEWTVSVRHSPFAIKTLDVTAVTAEEAKKKFIAANQVRHEEMALKALETKGVSDSERQRVAKEHRAACADGIARADQLDWDIRTKEEIDAIRDDLKRRREKRWGTGDDISLPMPAALATPK